MESFEASKKNKKTTERSFSKERRGFMKKAAALFAGSLLLPKVLLSEASDNNFEKEDGKKEYLSHSATLDEMVEYIKEKAESVSYSRMWDDGTRLLCLSDNHPSSTVKKHVKQALEESSGVATDFALEMIPQEFDKQVGRHINRTAQTATDSLDMHISGFEYGNEEISEQILDIVDTAGEHYDVHPLDRYYPTLENYLIGKYKMTAEEVSRLSFGKKMLYSLELQKELIASGDFNEYDAYDTVMRNRKWSKALEDVANDKDHKVILFAGGLHFGYGNSSQFPSVNEIIEGDTKIKKKEVKVVQYAVKDMPMADFENIVAGDTATYGRREAFNRSAEFNNKLREAAELAGYKDTEFMVFIDPKERKDGISADVIVYSPEE